MSTIIIREIQKADNVAIAKVIREVLIEHNAPMGNTGHTSCPVWMLKIL
ncbi:hypothetical protein [Flavobacterium endophyticum]|nr:hypothetical protein [Flavobacterium endophyticum]